VNQPYSVGAKRRARKRKRMISLPGADPIPQAPRMGRPATTEPPPIHAARARRCNLDTGSTLHESDMGRCIIALSEGQERDDIRETWAAISAAHRNFRLRIIGQTGDPKLASTPMMSDAMETDPSLRVDLRTADERDEAARRAWGDWLARIKALPFPGMISTIRGALDGFMGEGVALWRDGKPTTSGAVAEHALRLLTEKR